MQVKNHLPAAFFNIKKKLVSGGIHILLLSHLSGCHDHFRQDGMVGFDEIVDAPDMPFGNNQQMHGRMGVNVPENHQVVILIKKVGIDLAVGDFTEQAIFFHGGNLLLALPSTVMASDGENRVAEKRFKNSCSYRLSNSLVKKTMMIAVPVFHRD
jgi:hypothetical protein